MSSATAAKGAQWLLKGMGAAALAALAAASLKYLKIKSSNCDARCAAAKMPADAYKGKIVWITGGSSGIGKGVAELCAKQGARIILSSRREKELQEVAQELGPLLKASGGDVKIMTIDLGDLSSLPAKALQAQKLFGAPVDVLINNGGYSSRAMAREVPGIEEDVKMMNVNFFSWIALAKAVLPARGETREVGIVNVSSLAGKVGMPLRTMYCAAKYAVIGWFDALRAEEAGFYKHNVKVLNVCPGSVKTAVSSNSVTADGSKLGHTDPNIAAGLPVEFVADRIMASLHCGLYEIWIAHWRELRNTYITQYHPDKFKDVLLTSARAVVRGTMGDEWVKGRL